MRIIGTAGIAGLALLLPGVVPGNPVHADQPAQHSCRTADETGAALDAAGAQCAELQVPLNYADPDGRPITLAIARRAKTDTAHELGTLVVNVGGPEASRQGVTWFLDKNPSLAARYAG